MIKMWHVAHATAHCQSQLANHAKQDCEHCCRPVCRADEVRLPLINGKCRACAADLCKMCGECREWQQCDSCVLCPMTEDSWVPVSVLLDLSANEGANVVLEILALHDADETSVDMAEIDILNHVAAIYHNLDQQHSL